MDDNEIITLYLTRQEEAIAETDKKYRQYCHRIAYDILHNDADAEEIINDTYLKAWNSIPPNKPAFLKSYLGMICRRLSFDAYNAKNTQKRGGNFALVLDELSEVIPDSAGGEDIGESLALREALEKFIRSLPEKNRHIFLRRYWYATPPAQIAADYGMTVNHVTVLLCQIRKKLKKFLAQEGFEL